MGYNQPPLRGRVWTPADIATLKALYADNLTMSDMAEALKRTRNSVLSKCHTLKLPERRRNAGGRREVQFDEARRHQLTTAFESGQTLAGMAKACGATQDQVRKKLNNLKLSISSRDGITPRRAASAKGKDGNAVNLKGARQVVAYREPPRDPMAPESARDALGGLFTIQSIPNTGRCKWPHGDVGSDSFHLCGNDAKAGQPYCLYHLSRRKGATPPSAEGFAFGNSAARVFP